MENEASYKFERISWSFVGLGQYFDYEQRVSMNWSGF